jgi:hypothetical protein
MINPDGLSFSQGREIGLVSSAGAVTADETVEKITTTVEEYQIIYMTEEQGI